MEKRLPIIGRSLECLLLFGGVPTLLLWWHSVTRVSMWPVLFAMFLLTLFLGWRDPEVRFRAPGLGRSGVVRELGRVLLTVLLAAVVLFAFTAWVYPELLLRLPRQRPRLWVMIMVLYPLVSVWPQEYIFRTFFLQRYRCLFGSGGGMILANALVFGWAHVWFGNWIAPVLSIIGGALFAHTWLRTRQTWLSSLEHGLLGDLIFTTGLGWFFFAGSAHHVQQLIQ